MENKSWCFLSQAIGFYMLLWSVNADAKPGGPVEWCLSYPSAEMCQGQTPTCKLCHTSTGYNVAWNDYGSAVYGELYNVDPTYDSSDSAFNDLVGQAALNIESQPADHDGDGLTTLEEILLGTHPGDAEDYFFPSPSPIGDENPNYQVGEYDPNVAYTRTMVAFCGRSPTYGEKEAFKVAADQVEVIETTLDNCMRSDFWRNEALPQLADDKIRPIPRFEFWDWDYRLWRYANLPPCPVNDLGCGDSLDRSARDLLTGDYHVREPQEGMLIKDPDNGQAPAVPQSCDQNNPCGYDEVCSPGGVCVLPFGYQSLGDANRRAGMITTKWYHFVYTMFSAMPRTSAAQALRAYLGTDIARQEGLVYQEGEPRDLDEKGVANTGCLECHMRLDSATYVFASYNGIQDTGLIGDYNPDRPLEKGLWDPNDPSDVPQAFFDGAPVSDLVEWSEHAAASDAFKRNHAETFFRYAVGRSPRPDEADAFNALWMSMEEDNYETPKLLHRLVKMVAFGGV
jgi:hypothetical protein